MAFDYLDNDIEHMQAVKNAKINLVKVTPAGNIIQKENYLVVNFAQNFNSKYYKPGDYVQFSFDQDAKRITFYNQDSLDNEEKDNNENI